MPVKHGLIGVNACVIFIAPIMFLCQSRAEALIFLKVDLSLVIYHCAYQGKCSVDIKQNCKQRH